MDSLPTPSTLEPVAHTQDQVQLPDQEGRRLRTLTEKGEDLYRTSCEKYHKQLNQAWKETENILSNASDCPTDIKSLNAFEENLIQCQNKYLTCCDSYEKFLLGASTQDANEQLKCHIEIRITRKNIVSKVMDQITTLKQEALETLTVGSNASGGSSRLSNSSSVAQRKRAKANAQRARLEFVAKEADMLRQRAEIEASLKVLKQQENVAAAEAEAQALECMVEIEPVIDIDDTPGPNRVEAYVNEQARSVANSSLRTPLPRLPCAPPTPRYELDKLSSSSENENVMTHNFCCAKI